MSFNSRLIDFHPHFLPRDLCEPFTLNRLFRDENKRMKSSSFNLKNIKEMSYYSVIRELNKTKINLKYNYYEV